MIQQWVKFVVFVAYPRKPWCDYQPWTEPESSVHQGKGRRCFHEICSRITSPTSSVMSFKERFPLTSKMRSQDNVVSLPLSLIIRQPSLDTWNRNIKHRYWQKWCCTTVQQKLRFLSSSMSPIFRRQAAKISGEGFSCLWYWFYGRWVTGFKEGHVNLGCF